MFVVVVYDVGVERLAKVRRILSRYLLWTQNSVFEGDIDRESLQELLEYLDMAIDRAHDRIRVYVREKGNMEIHTLGYDKATYSVI